MMEVMGHPKRCTVRRSADLPAAKSGGARSSGKCRCYAHRTRNRQRPAKIIADAGGIFRIPTLHGRSPSPYNDLAADPFRSQPAYPTNRRDPLSSHGNLNDKDPTFHARFAAAGVGRNPGCHNVQDIAINRKGAERRKQLVTRIIMRLVSMSPTFSQVTSAARSVL